MIGDLLRRFRRTPDPEPEPDPWWLAKHESTDN